MEDAILSIIELEAEINGEICKLVQMKKDIVHKIKMCIRDRRIAGKLAVLLRRHQDAEPVLVVNDVEKPVRYDDAVPGAEAALDPHSFSSASGGVFSPARASQR